MAGGVLQVAIAACMWGTWSLFLRTAGVSAFTSAPLLFAVTAVAVLPLVRLEAIRPRWDRAALLLLLANAAFDATNVLTFFGAMDRTTVAIAVLTHYLAPLVVAVLAPFVDRERVRGAVAATIVATLGLALVLRPWASPDPGPTGAATAHANLVGALLGTTSAFAYAGNVFVVRRLAARVGPARALAWHAVLATLFLLPFAEPRELLSAGPRMGLLLVGALGPGALAGWLFLRGLGRVGSTRAAVLAFLEPIVAVVVGWSAFDERLAPVSVLGGALVLGAGAWVTLAGRET